MAEIDLNEKFPDLDPINKAPSLWTANGVGLTVYGSRDHDEETKTYIKTHCFIFLFVPIFALGAYRVAKAGHDRWYFLGRERLSILAKVWNLVVLVGLGGGISLGVWNAYYHSPNAVADRQLARAETLLVEGKAVEAANLYRSVSYGPSDRKDQGRTRLEKLHEHPKVTAADLTTVSQVFAIELAARRETSGDPVGKAVFDSAMSLVAERGESDLPGAAELLQTVKPVAADLETFHAARRTILETLVQSKPNDLQLVSQFAETLEALNEVDQCEAILAPHADKLAATEGARILGQIWARAGKVDEAHGLLAKYCATRLQQLNAAESSLQRLVEGEQDRILRDLNNGKAPKSFYDRYDQSDEEAQVAMLQEYMAKALENNRAIDEAQDQYIAQTNVVPVALDLGMVQLRRAQAMTDKTQQRDELQAAETTFKSIKNVAGETDEYRLYMGQVNYWLGKYDAGRQLFDALLASNNREFHVLLGVSQMVREVGRSVEARKLVEEAYENATDVTEKQMAAEVRSSMMTDNDDRIKWLGRANQQKPQIKAAFKSAQGSQAFLEGDFDQAETLFRASIAAYDELPETTSVLNNSGLTVFELYRITSDQKDFTEGLRRIEKAISLEPTDSVIRSNAAHVVLTAVYSDIIKDSLDLNTLKLDASTEMLSYLYIDDAGKDLIREKLRGHDGMKKAISLLENVVLLAPKNAGAHGQLAMIHHYDQNVEALKQVRDAVTAAKPEIDTADIRAFHAGEQDEQARSQFAARIDRIEKALQASQPGTLTHACAVGFLINRRVAGDHVIPFDDTDELVEIAEAAWEQTPSSGSRNALYSLYLARAHQTLKKENDQYRQFADKITRGIPAHYAIAIAAAEGGALSEAVVKNSDYTKSLELVKNMMSAFPQRLDAWEWAIFRHADPELAKKIAQVAKQNELDLVLREIYLQVAPGNATNAFQIYWYKLSQGDADAKSAFQSCVELGVPIPIDLD